MEQRGEVVRREIIFYIVKFLRRKYEDRKKDRAVYYYCNIYKNGTHFLNFNFLQKTRTKYRIRCNTFLNQDKFFDNSQFNPMSRHSLVRVDTGYTIDVILSMSEYGNR